MTLDGLRGIHWRRWSASQLVQFSTLRRRGRAERNSPTRWPPNGRLIEWPLRCGFDPTRTPFAFETPAYPLSGAGIILIAVE